MARELYSEVLRMRMTKAHRKHLQRRSKLEVKSEAAIVRELMDADIHRAAVTDKQLATESEEANVG